MDGSVDFYRSWSDYKIGFGNISGEFWMGNDLLHNLTSGGEHQLRIDLEDWNGEKKYAEYDHFSIGDEQDKYRLRFGSYYGNAGQVLSKRSDTYPVTFCRS